jgi:hypothetical protein
LGKYCPAVQLNDRIVQLLPSYPVAQVHFAVNMTFPELLRKFLKYSIVAPTVKLCAVDDEPKELVAPYSWVFVSIPEIAQPLNVPCGCVGVVMCITSPVTAVV